MNKIKQIITALLILQLGFGVYAQENYKEINTKQEYSNDKPHKVKKLKDIPQGGKAKNVILLIGDGMGTAHLYAGLTANHGKLHIQNMKYMGLAKTSSSDKYVTDSAAGGTALASGVKTTNGTVGLNANGEKATTILEIAEKKGKATGLISTSAITHATPASFIAHQPQRSMYEEIAADFLETDVDVIIGGGYTFFSERVDKRDLIEELEEKGYFVTKDLASIDKNTKGNVVALTADAHNKPYKERGDMLPEATKKSINILNQNSAEGFFLMIEGSMIDWGAHKNDISYVVDEMLDFDRAVGEALKFAAKDKNTLVIVTADHETGGLAIIDGDEKRGYVKANFGTGGHTGVGVPVFAYGPGAEDFMGIYENTEIFDKMLKHIK